jgi:dCTP deaminase
MILTDREIQVAIAQEQITIVPRPALEQFSSTSVDLTLSPQVRVWRTSSTPEVEPLVLSPGSPGYRHDLVAAEHTELLQVGNEGYVMEPQTFILAWTREHIKLPTHSRIAARVEGKSSLARCAIAAHVTAPTIHAGFEGQIQLEICNLGPLRVRLIPGMPICQLIFEQTLGTPEKGYQGQFAGQHEV